MKSKVKPRKVLRNNGAKVTKLRKDQGSTKRYFRRHRTIELGEALKSNISKKMPRSSKTKKGVEKR